MKMKAAVYHGPKDLRVEEIDVRELKEILWCLWNRCPYFPWRWWRICSNTTFGSRT